MQNKNNGTFLTYELDYSQSSSAQRVPCDFSNREVSMNNNRLLDTKAHIFLYRLLSHLFSV